MLSLVRKVTASLASFDSLSLVSRLICGLVKLDNKHLNRPYINSYKLFYINLYSYRLLFLLPNNNMENKIYESQFLK
jgi:hypothetical protein